jgi:hypothetical protein
MVTWISELQNVFGRSHIVAEMNVGTLLYKKYTHLVTDDLKIDTETSYIHVLLLVSLQVSLHTSLHTSQRLRRRHHRDLQSRPNTELYKFSKAWKRYVNHTGRVSTLYAKATFVSTCRACTSQHVYL